MQSPKIREKLAGKHEIVFSEINAAKNWRVLVRVNSDEGSAIGARLTFCRVPYF